MFRMPLELVFQDALWKSLTSPCPHLGLGEPWVGQVRNYWFRLQMRIPAEGNMEQGSLRDKCSAWLKPTACAYFSVPHECFKAHLELVHKVSSCFVLEAWELGQLTHPWPPRDSLVCRDLFSKVDNLTAKCIDRKLCLLSGVISCNQILTTKYDPKICKSWSFFKWWSQGFQ